MHKSLRNLLWMGAAVAVPAAVNAVIAARAAHATQPLPGDIGYYDWVYGRVAYYRLGHGDPLLLVHHPSPGGCAWEWRRVFPELANRHTVFALDLLGFGLSEKPNIAYTGRMYADLVHDFLQDVVGEKTAGVGSGLGGAYLVNAAVRQPEAISRLALVNPTGCTSSAPSYRQAMTWNALRSPVLGTSVYYALLSRDNLARELATHIYYDAALVTPALVDDCYTFAHQPGSQYGAAAYLTGRLDIPMRLAFALLKQPVLLVWGHDAYYTPVTDAADLLYRHPETRLLLLDECGMYPHDEKAGEFLRAVEDFLIEPTAGEMAA